jgi:hypothetical protein
LRDSELRRSFDGIGSSRDGRGEPGIRPGLLAPPSA